MSDNRFLRAFRAALLAAGGSLSLAAGAWGAAAGDSASLQFTVPAPDPVQAGETLNFQALAVNTGVSSWTAGSYYWVAEIYDLERRLVARTDQVSPREGVAAGAVAAISLPFRVPETYFGRRLYRMFLVKDTQTLIQSDFKAFQVVEKAIPPPPEVVDYRLEGNVTVSYKNTSRHDWETHSGATTVNLVGKLKESSYLFNSYVLHEPGKVVDPFILLFTYYAPWGTIYGGDIVPSLSPLAVWGQGMRGGMLEQKKGRWDWNVVGGQTVKSQAGTATTNGRYARSLYAARGGGRLTDNLKLSVNYFLSSDETGSLSSDPRSSDFRGPSLVAQKNSGYGASVLWEPRPRLAFSADYQSNEFFADASKAGTRATAWRGEVRLDRKLFSFKSYVQRADTGFVAFGAPAVVGDRMTYDAALNLYPAAWYTLSLTGNQFTDNLSNNPRRVTTTQRLVNFVKALQFRTGTGVTLSGSLNTAQGKPRTALDNQTTTVGAAVSQVVRGHSGSLSFQNSSFKDKNKLSHDLDTQTLAFSASMRLPRGWGSSLGATRSETKDKVDGSKRTSLAVSPSVSAPIRPTVWCQLWGTMTQTKNTSPSFPSDLTVLSVNSEATWSRDKQTNLTFGLGYNKNQDKVRPSQSYNEVVVSARVSYSF